MGISSYPFLVSLKGIVQEKQETQQILESQARRRRQMRKQRIITRNKRCRRALMKYRGSRLESCRRTTAFGIQRRVRTLKKLVPRSESMGLEGLFRETADYILTLQMRVKVMQIMVKVLAGSSDDNMCTN
ncbi:hypothetical protein JCGZ_14053 [Jatropha curcas]|uniref:BHLH domain-containing protein n=1 Tax=Jatropha curcas TaxID=180498 RepID=A0A067JWP1_JATCU|nr:hypothetical protein JCGZ_14053 [Jatropha curcas]